MITVLTRRVRKGVVRETLFLFHTQAEAIAFVSGLRAMDGWGKDTRLLDIVVQPQEPMTVTVPVNNY